MFQTAAYCQGTLDDLLAAMRKTDVPDQYHNALEEHYKDKSIFGKAYIKEVRHVWGETVVLLSTEPNGIRPDPITIKVFLTYEQSKSAGWLEKGQKVYFSGYVRNVSRTTIVVRQGTIKK